MHHVAELVNFSLEGIVTKRYQTLKVAKQLLMENTNDLCSDLALIDLKIFTLQQVSNNKLQVLATSKANRRNRKMICYIFSQSALLYTLFVSMF